MKRVGKWLLLLLLLSGCLTETVAVPAGPDMLPTAVSQAVLATVTALPEGQSPAGSLPPTFTPAAGAPAPTTSPAPYSSPTSAPTGTLAPTQTPTASPTLPPTVGPTATPNPTTTLLPPLPTASLLPTQPPAAANRLPNPSFEEGWYNLNGIPELQIANRWRLQWEVGDNPLDPDPWNDWVRPEARVLSRDFLPASEHALYIWDGDHTIKIFKGQGAISFQLLTDVTLPPGTYELRLQVFPDLIVDYAPNGEKIFADDVLAGEVRLITPDGGTGWMLPVFGVRNVFVRRFTLTTEATVSVGGAFRGRWAILNNGWFIDDWGLYAVNP